MRDSKTFCRMGFRRERERKKKGGEGVWGCAMDERTEGQ